MAIFQLSLKTQRYYRISVSIFFFIQGLTFASWASRIPDIKNKLSLSEAELGAVLLALSIGQLVGMTFSGWLVTKFGSRKMLTIAALTYPASLILLGVTETKWQLAGALVLFGLFANLSNISVNTQGVGVERIYRRSIMASFHGLWSLAGFTGGIISSVMVAADLTPLYHFGIIYIITFLLWLSARTSMLPRDASHGESSGPIFVKPDKHIMRLGLIAFACLVAEGTMFDWSGVYFKDVIKPQENLVRLGYIAFMCTMATGRFTADWLVTKFGVVPMLKASGIIICIGLLISVIFPYLVTATIGFMLVGLGVSSVVPLVYSLAGKSKTMKPGMALAAVSSIGFFGFLFGPPLIGFIAEVSSLRWSFALIAILGLGTTMLAGKVESKK